MKNNDKTTSKLLLTLLVGCVTSAAIAQPCSGVPAIGPTSATNTVMMCSGAPDLTLSSYPAETGITYQWQVSPEGQGNFANVSGLLTNPAYTAEVISSSMDYRVIATCTNGMLSDTSDTITILVDNAPANITSDPANASMICPNAGASFAGTATGAGLSYQWLMNGNTIVTNGGTYSGATTNTLNIATTAGLDNNTYQLIAVGCNSDTSTAATLTVNNANIWTGAASSTWNEPSNWGTCGVPGITSNVTIPSAPINQPVVNVGQVNTLTIDAGASVTFAAGGSLVVASNITNNGTFDATNGTVEFSGQGVQNIPGGTYTNIIISGGGYKFLDTNVTVTDVLTLTLGNVILGEDTLTLESPELTAGGAWNAYIITDGNGVVRGMDMDAADSVTFHVGPTALMYNPIGMRNNGVADDFSVRVWQHVYMDGIGVNIAQVEFPVVDRTWTVNEGTQGGSLVTMSPYWLSPNDEVNNFDNTHVFVIHHDDINGWRSLMDSTLVGPMASGANPYYTTAVGVSDFSPFSVGSGGQFPLTIKLTDIAATNVGTSNKVDWKSVAEALGDKYELQHSTNGSTFRTIATINAKGESASYTYYDKNAVQGVNYYRLKMTDVAGHSEFSKVVSATMGLSTASSVNVYPNPVSSTLTLAVNQVVGKASASVTDVTGKVVSTIAITDNATDINMSTFAPGVYFIKYKDDVANETIRVIKK
jgi:hypothetical protein